MIVKIYSLRSFESQKLIKIEYNYSLSLEIKKKSG